ncbi:MAG: ATP-binding protein [Coxiellaceae bacterium]|nr:ATP-binding protein [Coxiellaceae bacterium]
MKPIYFTSKVATDASFCNRTEEQAIIVQALQKNQHLVIVAPRRYGKTSLVINTLTRQNTIFARVDLFCVVYENEICHKVAQGVSKLIRQITPFSTKSLKFIGDCFKHASITIKAGEIEVKAELDKITSDPTLSLEDLLEGLEKLAKKQKKPVVLFFDEFQDVLKTESSDKIQAAIRAIAQHSQYVTYIFSGSSRAMLNKIFDDKKQPLYMLCKKIMLNRIDASHFSEHIMTAFLKHFKKKIPNELIKLILEKTECHSYYVNVLCDKLWENKTIPSESDIEHAWREVINENKGKIISDLEPLNTNKLKVLSTISQLNYVKEPSSKYFLDQVKLPLSSTQNAMKYLLNYDFIFETDKGISLVDPVMKVFL